MTTFSIESTINQFKNSIDGEFHHYDSGVDLLYNLRIGLDGVHRMSYMSAEVRPNRLDKGFDPDDIICRSVLREGVKGDKPAQYIGKKLGGGGSGRNVFPLNEQLDTTQWENDENVVYAHLMQNKSFLHALLQYGIEYSREFNDEVCRPFKIYRLFKLYDNEEFVGQVEGILENTSPKYTKPDYYTDAFNRPYNLSTRPR